MKIQWRLMKLSHLKSRSKEIISFVILTLTIIILHCIITWEQNADLWRIPLDNADPFNILNPPEILPSSGTHKVSKMIHQTWKTELIPQKFIPWIKSWIRTHPDWEYWFWTDKSARDFIAEKYPYFLATYDAYPGAIQRADAMRYFVLYEYGGVYADLDMESLLALDPLTYKYDCFIAQEPYEHPALDGNFEHLAMNAIMGCQKGHPFMKAVFEALPDFSHFWHVLDSTGPHFITYVYNKYTKLRSVGGLNPTDTVSGGVYLAPPSYFLPTIDPTKYYGFKRKCSHYDKLSDVAKKACQGLKAYGFKRQPLSHSFTIHHWIHSYFENNYSSRSPVSIHDIVDHVNMYGTNNQMAGPTR